MIINDFMMAIFFLYVGLEIKKEILEGSLSSFRKASFPVSDYHIQYHSGVRNQ